MKNNPRQTSKTILGYLNDYRFNSILVKSFCITVTLLVLTYMLIMGAISTKMQGILINEAGTLSGISLSKTRERIDSVIDESAKIAGRLSLDEDVAAFLLPGAAELFGHDQNARVQEKIRSFFGVFDYIDSIYIYSSKNQFIISNEGGCCAQDFEDINWLENLTLREYEPARMISREKYGTYPHLVSYIYPMRLTQMQFLGGIIINIDVDKLERLIVPGVPVQGELLIIADSRNNIIFSSDRRHLAKNVDGIEFYNSIDSSTNGYQIVEYMGEKVLVTTDRSDRFGWTYISTVPMSAFDQNSSDVNDFYFWLFISCLVFTVIAAFGISVYCYKPVRNILDLVKAPELFDETYFTQTDLAKDETQDIALNIVRNLYSNTQLQMQMKQYADIIDRAQLTALQAQISPHFLFNTLENIRWRAIAACGEDDSVPQMILNLSGMLRLGLDNTQHIVTIAQEIENTKLYIEILKIRYEGKIKVEWDVDEEVLNHPIVKVSLQPIIENSVYHGIKPLRKQGVIVVSIKKLANEIVIRVSDNGVGMSLDEVDRLNAYIEQKYAISEGHIGLMNVARRLQLLMGENACMKIASAQNLGTTITIKLPASPDPDGAENTGGEVQGDKY